MEPQTQLSLTLGDEHGPYSYEDAMPSSGWSGGRRSRHATIRGPLAGTPAQRRSPPDVPPPALPAPIDCRTPPPAAHYASGQSPALTRAPGPNINTGHDAWAAGASAAAAAGAPTQPWGGHAYGGYGYGISGGLAYGPSSSQHSSGYALSSEASGSLDGGLPTSTSSSDSETALAAHPAGSPPPALQTAWSLNTGEGEAAAAAAGRGALSRLYSAVRSTSASAARAGGSVLKGLQSGLEALVTQPEDGGFDLLPRTAVQADQMVAQAARNKEAAEAFYNMHPIHGLY
jgi:hypothetical protein